MGAVIGHEIRAAYNASPLAHTRITHKLMLLVMPRHVTHVPFSSGININVVEFPDSERDIT